MNKIKALLFLIVIIIIYCSITPYKEILSCKDDVCTVNRIYFYKTDLYKFNRNDDIHIRRSRLGRLGYNMYNYSDNLFQRVFENSFIFDNEYKVLRNIKSNKPYKIIKYYLWYKIN